MGLPIPKQDILDAAFMVPNKKVLSDDNQSLLSAIGNRGNLQPKRAYLFDGLDDQLTHNNTGGIYNFGDGLTDNPFTITAWVKMIDATNFIILEVGGQYSLRTQGADLLQINCYDADTANRISAATTALTSYENEWLFVAATYDGSAATGGTAFGLYVYDKEGTLLLTKNSSFDTGTYVAMEPLNSLLTIGYNVATAYSEGYIFDVRLHNAELTQSQIFDKGFGKSRFTLDNEILWNKCDTDLDDYSPNSVVANTNGRLLNFTTSTFFYEGVDVPYSFQNEIGFTLSDGVTYYEDSGGVNLIPSGVYIPRDENNTTKCAAYLSGGARAELIDKGKAKEFVKIAQVNVGNPDGLDDVLNFTDLTGVTIVSSEGTSTPSINGNNIEFTAGTIWNLILSDGTHLTFNEGNGLTVYDISGNDNHGTWQNVTNPTQWTKSDVAINYLLLNGCEVYTEDGGSLITYIPLKSDGSEITPTISGYTKQRTTRDIILNRGFSLDYDCELNFQYHKSLPDTLPTNYTLGVDLPSNVISREVDSVVSKILIGKVDETLPVYGRLARYTQDEAFVLTVKTDNTGPSNNDQFTIATNGLLTYDYAVDWGDGSAVETGLTGDTTHTFPAAGTYTVRIAGKFPSMSFAFAGDNQKVLSIENWGKIKWESFAQSFHGCTNMVINATDIPDLTLVTDMSFAFARCFSMNYNFNNWDVSGVTNMNSMFFDCNIFNQPLDNWDVSSVTDMDSMFKECSVFNQDIGGWNTASVTSMNSMFESASSFNQDISGWDVSGTTSLLSVFQLATSFDQNLAAWDVSNKVTLGGMFTGVTLSTANYDAILIGWEGQAVQNVVTFDAGGSQYTSGGAAATARTNLINDHTWTINDGGSV